jgi:predicted GNAT family acetyltransferase
MLWLRLLLVGSAACLYTDLANSTSNKIYAAIGYQSVADFLRYDIS